MYINIYYHNTFIMIIQVCIMIEYSRITIDVGIVIFINRVTKTSVIYLKMTFEIHTIKTSYVYCVVFRIKHNY